MATKQRRARGPMLDYRPQATTRALLDDVLAILADADADGVLPLSVRAIYYRLLGTGKYAKGKQLAARVSEHVSNARRAGLIPWHAVTDSGETWAGGTGWPTAELWIRSVKRRARGFRLDRSAGQPRLLVWCEAKGLVPLLSRAVDDYDVRVLSTSGYDSTTVRHAVARDAYEPTEILHVGDLDPHGLAIYQALVEDVTAWAEHYDNEITFTRLAVTPEQVTEYDLPDDPDVPGAVQAEAIPFAVLRDLTDAAVADRYDLDRFADLLANERGAQDALVAALDGVEL